MAYAYPKLLGWFPLPTFSTRLIPWSFTEPCWFEVQLSPLWNLTLPRFCDWILLVKGSSNPPLSNLRLPRFWLRIRWVILQPYYYKGILYPPETKMTGWKHVNHFVDGISYWKRGIFQCHVSFRGCMHWACYFPHWYPKPWFYQRFRIPGTTSYQLSVSRTPAIQRSWDASKVAARALQRTYWRLGFPWW